MEPLASKYRPQNLDEYIGQEHLVGVGKPIRKFIESQNIPSMIFWGPPGSLDGSYITGKSRPDKSSRSRGPVGCSLTM